MPLGIGTSGWAIALPVGKDNLGLNPSFEYGTRGVFAIQGAGLGSTFAKQQMGAVSAFMTPTSNGTSGAGFSTWTAANGSAYTVSVYVAGSVGGLYMIAVGDSAGLNLLGSTTFTGGGTWQRYPVSYTEAAGAVRSVVVRKASGASVGTVYVDAVQIELGSLTTYIDGDQDGCVWNGAPHASTSTRSSQSRAGGSIVSLADLGLVNIAQTYGVGMPPLENSSQSYAIIDGAQYQRTRAAQRAITFTSFVDGTTTQDYHVSRSRIIDALKIDLVTPQQPLRLYSVEGLGTLSIDAVYDSGFELGARDGPMAEDQIPLKFLAFNPYWSAPTQEGTSLAAYNTFGSANWAVSRDPNGVWGTMGPSGTATNGEIRTLFIGTDQRVLAGGSFKTAGGTGSGLLAIYDPPTNTWGTFAGGTVGGDFLYAIQQFPNGTILLGGSFTTVGGTSSRHIGYWAGANYGTFGGTASDAIFDIAINAYGTAFLGGQFLTLGGTTSPRIGWIANNALGTLVGGTVDQLVIGLTLGLDQTLYFGGGFTLAGGTAAREVALWNGRFGSMAGGVTSNGQIGALTTMLDGRIALGGQAGTFSGGLVTNNAAIWNGVGFAPIAQGLGTPGNDNVYTMFVDRNNTLYAAGLFSRAGSVILPDAVGKYIQGAWIPLDIALGAGVEVGFGGSTQIFTMAQAPNGTLYLGGDFAGSALYATVANVINTGRAVAYPTLRMRNLSSGTARVYELLNNTTGNGIYFSLVMQAQEVVTLDLTPGNRSFTSTFRGNIFGAVIPGSNLTTWNLQTGTNAVSFFADNASLETALFWTPTSWSNDGGTIY